LIDGILELLGKLVPQARPVVVRQHHVLNRVLVAVGLGRAEVERAHVHRLVGAIVFPMKRDADEAPLEQIAAADVHLDRAVAEIGAVNPREMLKT
jgi:hypothetical protein